MKNCLKLIPSPVYASANRQTLSVIEAILGNATEKDFFQNQSPPALLERCKKYFFRDFPKANFITVVDFFHGYGD